MKPSHSLCSALTMNPSSSALTNNPIRLIAPSNSKLTLFVLIATLLLPLTEGFARDRMDRRQNRQQERIDQGKSSGQLTEKESQALDRGQDRVEKMEDKAKSDGNVSGREAHRIEKMQDRQSRRIHRMKHNGRKAGN